MPVVRVEFEHRRRCRDLDDALAGGCSGSVVERGPDVGWGWSEQRVADEVLELFQQLAARVGGWISKEDNAIAKCFRATSGRGS